MIELDSYYIRTTNIEEDANIYFFKTLEEADARFDKLIEFHNKEDNKNMDKMEIWYKTFGYSDPYDVHHKVMELKKNKRI